VILLRQFLLLKGGVYQGYINVGLICKNIGKRKYHHC
jgi:hypothetical protein